MEKKPDWANIDDEEEDYDEQEQQGEAGESHETHGQTQGESRGQDSRPPGYRGGYNQRGGERGRGRGGRGGGRGSRGGASGRGDRGGRGDQRDQRDQRDRPQGPKASQPKHEMAKIIKDEAEKTILINLFNVEYSVKAEDIENLYKDVQINKVDQIKQGIFLLELEKDQALKLVDIGAKELNGRPFFMKIGFSNKRQHPDEQWHQVNAGKHKFDLARHEDKPRREERGYNRKEQNDFGGDFSYQRKPFNKDRHYNKDQAQEPVTIDPDNKFFKGHDLTATEFNIKFTKSTSSTKKDEATDASQQKVHKPNPFGGAVARDEKDYEKRKEEEKTQVKDLQEHFEEKKEELQKDSHTYQTPVNSPNTEFVEGENKETKGEDLKVPPGFGKGPKKSGWGDKKPEEKKPVTQTQPKAAEKSKPKQNKSNVFDLLQD